MRAALLVEPGRIEIGEVAAPEAGPGEVRIRVGGVGLCGSDFSVFSGKWPAPRYPWILGHEAFGIVESVGERIPASRVGETVVIEPNATCGQCTQCRTGRTSACQDRRSLGMNRPGAIAEMVVVPGENAWRVTPTEPEHLVCLEPLTVAEAALRRHPRPMPDAALVVGVGVQGLVMCIALLRRGVDTFVTDVNTDRIAFATKLGAQELEGAGVDRRFDLIVDTAGLPPAMGLAVERVEFGGSIIEISLESQPLELTARAIVRRQLELRGSLTYDHPQDFRASVELLESKAVLPGRIVTREYPIEDSQSALAGFPTALGKNWIRVAPS